MCRVLVFLCLLHVCVGSRVLVVFPVPNRSHTTLGDSLVQTLLDAGHKVTYVTPYRAVPTNEALTVVDIGAVADTLADRVGHDLIELVRSTSPPQRLLETGTTLAQRALEHRAMREILQDPDLTFDVVVAEWFYTGLLAPLASVYDCPLIWYSTVDANWMNLQLVHGQTNPAYAADPQSRHMALAPYNLRDRLDRLRQQAYLTAWMYYMTHYVEASAYQEIYRTPLQLRARYPPNYEALVYNASMLLINSHPLLGQTLALPANAKYVGGHHIEVPIKPLPKNLQTLLNKSKNGVIFFNLGSNVRSKDLPDYMKQQLLDVFGQLEQTIIWKFEEPFEVLPSNVHIVHRAPLASILNHPNTILFITHGGFTSYMEATYFGVPIIGIPIFGDQFLTMDLAAARGQAIRVGFTEYLPHRIKDVVKEILGNYSYRSNAKKRSKIFQNALVSPKKELLHWIELVANHEANHLRSPVLQLTILEKFHLDVLVVILMFAWFLTKVWKVIRVHWNSETEAADADKKNQ